MNRLDRLTFLVSGVLILFVLQFVLQNSFVWDDFYFVEQYEDLGRAESLGYALTRPFWENTGYRARQLSNLYRPFVSFLLALDGFIFGKSAVAFHALSLIALLGSALALGYFIKTTLPHENNAKAAFACALIFAIHPLSAEVLCMIANISDHLSFAFLLLGTTLIYRYFTTQQNRWFLIGASFSGLLSIASKEFGIVFLLSPIIAYFLIPNDARLSSRTKLHSISLWVSSILPSCIYLLARFYVFRVADNESDFFSHFAQPIDFAVTVLVGLGEGLMQTFAPIPRGAHVYIDPGRLLSWPAVVLLFVLAGMVVYRHKRCRTAQTALSVVGLGVAITLFLPSMLLVKSVPLGLRFPTRYFHLFMAGSVIALSPLFAKRWQTGLRRVFPVIVVLFSLLSFIRIDQWRDPLSFFDAEAELHPNSFFEQLNLATAYLSLGVFNKAEEALNRASQVADATDFGAQSQIFYFRSVVALQKDNDLLGAKTLIRKALRLVPDDLRSVYQAARIEILSGNREQAIFILQRASKASWFTPHQKKDIAYRIRAIQGTN